MATSETSISNLALTALGANLITNLGDDSTEANIARVHYEPSRDACLEAREWTFATDRVTLAKLKDTPEWGFGTAFQLPGDTIRVIEIRQASPERINFRDLSNPLDWRREGDTIVCDAKSVKMRYIKRVKDPLRFSASFIYTVSARMAFEMCMAVTQSTKMQENLWKVYQEKLAGAAATEGMQGRSEIVRSSRLTGIRGIGASTSEFGVGIV